APPAAGGNAQGHCDAQSHLTEQQLWMQDFHQLLSPECARRDDLQQPTFVIFAQQKNNETSA
ncbi:MAG TPA: hypothetical protein VIQ48_12050, partial [Rhodanobacter sp.]